MLAPVKKPTALEMAQPKVTPMTAEGEKTHSSVSASLTRTCICPKERGASARVSTV